jgi:putative nucleotidyltransferase with HDIG domain
MYAAYRIAHSRRVAAWALEIAGSCHIPAQFVPVLERAALSHDYPELFFDGGSVSRLFADLGVQPKDDRAASDLDVQCDQVLAAYHGVRRAHSFDALRLAEIIQVSDAFEQAFELQPYEGPGDQFEAHPAVEAVHSRLLRASRADVWALFDKLPAFPAVASSVLRLLSNPDVSLHAIERLASTDQVIAAELIKTANSGFYGRRRQATTLIEAISRVGVETTKRVLCAIALRPLFLSTGLRQLWNHSLQAAQIAERIASVSQRIDPAEAFLAGLVHDIGRIPLALLPAQFNQRSAALIEKGCPPVLVETAFCGVSHAEIGADLLNRFRFPATVIEAVRFHHRVELTASPFAGLLYVTEFWSEEDEDLPSTLRLLRSFQTLGIDMEALATTRPASDQLISCLAA